MKEQPNPGIGHGQAVFRQGARPLVGSSHASTAFNDGMPFALAKLANGTPPTHQPQHSCFTPGGDKALQRSHTSTILVVKILGDVPILETLSHSAKVQAALTPDTAASLVHLAHGRGGLPRHRHPSRVRMSGNSSEVFDFVQHSAIAIYYTAVPHGGVLRLLEPYTWGCGGEIALTAGHATGPDAAIAAPAPNR